MFTKFKQLIGFSQFKANKLLTNIKFDYIRPKKKTSLKDPF